MITAIALAAFGGLFGGPGIFGGGSCANGSCSAPSAAMPMMSSPMMSSSIYSAPPMTYVQSPRIIQSAPIVTDGGGCYSSSPVQASSCYSSIAPAPPPAPSAESYRPRPNTRKMVRQAQVPSNIADPNRPGFVKRASNGLPVDFNSQLVPKRRVAAPEPPPKPTRFALYDSNQPIFAADTYGFYEP